MSRRRDKVRTRSDGIVCQNKVSASLESTVKEDSGLDIPVSSTLECASGTGTVALGEHHGE